MLFSLEVGRDEPRLFDETLDWMVTNHQTLSLHRLRGLCAGVEDRTLVEAAVDWSAQWGARGRSQTRAAETSEPSDVVELFRGLDAKSGGMDRVFYAHGLARPLLHPSYKSQPANLERPINFALRLRRLFGVGAKAEVIRALLTIRAPRLDAQVVARSAGFSSRNVREALNQLAEASVVNVTVVGDARSYSMSTDTWALALGFPDGASLPGHFDWAQAFRALATMSRWINDPGLESNSEYMLASSARTLFDEVASDLRYAGIHAGHGLPPGSTDWAAVNGHLMSVARQVLQAAE